MKKIIIGLSSLFFLVFSSSSLFAYNDITYWVDGTPVSFTDVSQNYNYYEAINFVSEAGIVSGYPDGTYKPDKTLNRAELLKIIIESVYSNEFESYAGQNCFNDVPAAEWYTKYVCFAKAMGIVEGYAGNLFKPSQDVNFVEALKMTVATFGFYYDETDPWYKGVIETASDYNFIPLDVTAFDQNFNRGQMADMITRILSRPTSNDGINMQAEYLGDYADMVQTYEMIEGGFSALDISGPPDYSDVCPDVTPRVCEGGNIGTLIDGTCDFYCPEDE